MLSQMQKILPRLFAATVLLYLLVPEKISCGQPHATCAYPTDIGYAVSYDIQPKLATRLELLTRRDNILKYNEGEDRYGLEKEDTETYESNL
jgi:hypothetical protein